MEDCDTVRCLEINARFIIRKLDKDKSTKDNTHFLLVINMFDQCPNLRALSLVWPKRFVVSNATVSQAYGISIKFLPGTFDVQAHELTDEDYVTLHGLGSSAKDNNTADVYLKLKSDQASLVVEGIGLAFEGATQVIDDYINASAKIQVRSHLPLWLQAHLKPGTLQGHPSRKSTPNAVPRSLSCQSDIPNDDQTSLNAIRLEEIFWVVEDYDEIQFLEAKGPRRARESVYLKFDAGPKVAKRRVAAIGKVFCPVLPDLPGNKTHQREDEDYDEDENKDEDKNSPAGPGLSAVTTAISSTTRIPTWSRLFFRNFDLSHAIVSRSTLALPPPPPPPGLVGIFGFAGSGKTDTLAIVAHLFLSKYSRLDNDTFRGEAVDVVNSLRSAPFGWAFVTGGPGAGKTTAAVAIVKAITSHPVESIVQAQEDDATWKAIEDAAAVNENVETAAPEVNAFALPEGDFTLPVYKLPTEDTGDDEAADANAQGTAWPGDTNTNAQDFAWPGEASGNDTQLHVCADDAGNKTALESWTVPPAGTEPGIVSVDLHTSIVPAQPSPLWHRHPSLSRRPEGDGWRRRQGGFGTQSRQPGRYDRQWSSECRLDCPISR
ncbi:hypothetical protein NCS56_00132400 [Fusarium sp. Ph1]|nr:hypothetical protein NCS56_00132400 [Fusarium sp. Ph1]